MSNTNLYLSPHLDDVVFSCAGKITDDVANGKRVLVATFFSDCTNCELRKSEDSEALTKLGAEHIWLDFPDAPVRNSYYNSFYRIIVKHHPADEEIIQTLSTTVKDLINHYKPTRIYAPLGIGGHVDHQLLFETTRSLPNKTIWFYEERPYVFTNHAVDIRLSQIGAKSLIDKLVPEYLHSLGQQHYVKTYLPPGEQQDSCFAKISHLLKMTPKRNLCLSPHVHPIPLHDFSQKIDAVSSYKSQIPDFFETMVSYREAAQAYSHMLSCSNNVAERYWTM